MVDIREEKWLTCDCVFLPSKLLSSAPFLGMAKQGWVKKKKNLSVCFP